MTSRPLAISLPGRGGGLRVSRPMRLSRWRRIPAGSCAEDLASNHLETSRTPLALESSGIVAVAVAFADVAVSVLYQMLDSLAHRGFAPRLLCLGFGLEDSR